MDTLLDYEGLVYSIIGKYSRKYDFDDLYQVGMIGLIDAYNHYDENFDTKFSSYAYYYIIGEVNKYICESSSLKVSKDLIKLKKSIIKARDLLTQKLDRVPTSDELSIFLDIPLNDIYNALVATDYTESVEEFSNSFKCFDNTDADVLDLRCEIDKLPLDEKKIILARYYDELTQSETSKVLGISQVQVSRNEAKILKKLKTKL